MPRCGRASLRARGSCRAEPKVFEAALKEINTLGLDSACHHAQRRVSQVNAMASARWGLNSIEHWYGLPEAMFRDRTVQDHAPSYNYTDEAARYASGGPLWMQTAEPGSRPWVETLEEFHSLGVTLSPTFNIYIGHRDAARVRNSEWHEEFTAPQLWDFFEPSHESHGSVYGAWGTEQENPWRQAYVRWMAFANDYKNLGGRVTVGSDSGFIYKTYGFGLIEEMELFCEAGFHPVEVLCSATLHSADLIGKGDEIGSIEVGKRADLVVLTENPLANLKVLYGHGALRHVNGQATRVSAIKYTIKGVSSSTRPSCATTYAGSCPRRGRRPAADPGCLGRSPPHGPVEMGGVRRGGAPYRSRRFGLLKFGGDGQAMADGDGDGWRAHL